MKNTRFTANTLLGIIAINLTLTTLIQLDIFPPKAYANENTSMPINSNYRLVPLNEDGSIDVRISEEQLNEIKPLSTQEVIIKDGPNKSYAWVSGGRLHVQ